MRDVCSLIWLALIGLFRSRASLQAEILTLRHQLNVLRRKSPQRLIFTSIDRLVFAGLYRLAPGVLDALKIVRPETVIRWHRAGFRSMKTVDLEIRPIRHWNADRVRANVFLCMLAYHVEWHLRQALAPLLFHDTELNAARAERSSPVVSTEPSATAKSKKAIKRNADGQPVHSFDGLIDHLGTMTRNTMRMPLAKKKHFTLLSKSTPLQEAAFQLLGFDPKRVQ